MNLPLVSSVKNRLRLGLGRLPTTSVPHSRWFREEHWDGFHLHYFTIQSIRDLAKSANLKVIDINTVGKFSTVKNIFPGLLYDKVTITLRRDNS